VRLGEEAWSSEEGLIEAGVVSALSEDDDDAIVPEYAVYHARA